MNLLLATAAIAVFGTAFFGDKSSTETSQKENIRIMPVGRTPEPINALLTIAVPKNGEVVNGNPVWLQFRADGYTLGSNSQFDRADEIVNTDMGQTVHVIVDDYPYFPVNEPAIDPFNEDGYYWDMSYKFELPYKLKAGIHTVRVFLARSFGESLKGERTFHAIHFAVGGGGGQPLVDLSKPFLTYNEPSDQIHLVENKPVLLDFFLNNTELSQDGYKVRVTIDGKANRMLTSWQPYYIYGLKKGKHTLRLELLDSRNQLVPGVTNSVARTFTVH